MRRKLLKITVFTALGLVIVIFLLYVVIFISTPSERKGEKVSGFQFKSQTWSGEIRITGSVFFVPWTTLTLKPGTRILFEKQPDPPLPSEPPYPDEFTAEHKDVTSLPSYGKTHYKLFARLKAVGTAREPIVFTSAQKNPEFADWDSLQVYKNSILEYVELSYAHNGAYLQGEGTVIRNSTFHHSLWSCIDVWTKNVIIENNLIYECWHQAVGGKRPGEVIVRGNTIQDAQVSINCEYGATPTVVNNKIAGAPIAPPCGNFPDNQIEERAMNSIGGTYNSQVIYPANEYLE